jgi:hypothetical protein
MSSAPLSPGRGAYFTCRRLCPVSKVGFRADELGAVLSTYKIAKNRTVCLEPGMGIEPTSAFPILRVAAGLLYCSPPPEPFGLRWSLPCVPETNPGNCPGGSRLGTTALINMYVSSQKAYTNRLKVENDMPESSIGSSYLYFRLCSDHLSIEAIPRKQLSLDLSWVRENPIQDCELLMWTPQFVVLRTLKGEEVTIRRNGRMVIRKAASEKAAKKAASVMMEALLKGR